ncbi:MAG: hypothetical protein ACYCO3_03890, partial [Mycobacteriales bacterium]
PEPPNTQWVVDVAESLNATAATPTFTQYQVSDPGVVVHYGDNCNLGIYCEGSSTGNRSLVENNSVFTDKNGYAGSGTSPGTGGPSGSFGHDGWVALRFADGHR